MDIIPTNARQPTAQTLRRLDSHAGHTKLRNALVSVNMAETMVDSIQNFKSYVVATSVIDDCFTCN